MFSALGVEVAGQRAERLADLRLPPKQRNQIQSELRTRSLAVFASRQDGRRRRNRPRRLLQRPDGRPDGGEKISELKIFSKVTIQKPDTFDKRTNLLLVLRLFGILPCS